MTCWKKNCRTCKEVGSWEYIWGLPFKEFLSLVRWSTIVFMFISLIVGYAMFGWIGILIGWVFFYLMAQSDDGAVADVWNEFPPEEYPPNICSENISNCKICNNEYEHSFNVKYEKSLKWWERIL